jgi:hypothetical protein
MNRLALRYLRANGCRSDSFELFRHRPQAFLNNLQSGSFNTSTPKFLCNSKNTYETAPEYTISSIHKRSYEKYFGAPNLP